MRLTASTAVSERPVRKDDLERWANDEAVPALARIRRAVNYRSVEREVVVETDGAGTYSRIWTSEELPTNCTVTVEADVCGVTILGHAAERAAYVLRAIFHSIAGTIAQGGATATLSSYETAAGIDVRFGIDATARTVYLEGRDNAGSAMKFVGVVTMNEAGQ